MFLFSYGLTESLKWTFVNILSIKSDLKVTSLWLKKCLICACHASNIYHVHLKTKSPWWSLAVWLAKERFAKFLPFLLLYYRNVFEQKWQNGHFNTSIKNAYFYLKHWFILRSALSCPIRYELFFLARNATVYCVKLTSVNPIGSIFWTFFNYLQFDFLRLSGLWIPVISGVNKVILAD